MSDHRAARRTFFVAAALLAVAACAAPAGPPATPPPTDTATTATASAGVTTGPGSNDPVVDLTFTGDRSLVAKGSNGDCVLGEGADGATIGFGFLASERDYAGLGDSFNLTEDIASHKVSVKWVVAGTFYAGVFTSGVTVAPDHHSIMVSADIPAGVDRTEHLEGSISCP